MSSPSTSSSSKEANDKSKGSYDPVEGNNYDSRRWKN